MIPKDKREKIAEAYAMGMSHKDIIDKFNVSEFIIPKIANEYNLKLRGRQKYRINEEYFNKLDSLIKFYFLGLLFADGSFDKKGNRFSIGLIEEDKYILEKIKKNIYYDERPLYFSERNKKNKNHNNEYKLSISNKHMKETLLSYGLKPKKSLTITYPKKIIKNKDSFFSFLLGYFDGDGCFYWRKQKDNTYPVGQFHLCGTYDMLQNIKDNLEYYLKIKINSKVRKQSKNSNIYVFTISKHKYLFMLYKDLYKNDFYMIRKKQKFIEYLQEKNEITSW